MTKFTDYSVCALSRFGNEVLHQTCPDEASARALAAAWLAERASCAAIYQVDTELWNSEESTP